MEDTLSTHQCIQGIHTWDAHMGCIPGTHTWDAHLSKVHRSFPSSLGRKQNKNLVLRFFFFFFARFHTIAQRRTLCTLPVYFYSCPSFASRSLLSSYPTLPVYFYSFWGALLKLSRCRLLSQCLSFFFQCVTSKKILLRKKKLAKKGEKKLPWGMPPPSAFKKSRRPKTKSEKPTRKKKPSLGHATPKCFQKKRWWATDRNRKTKRKRNFAKTRFRTIPSLATLRLWCQHATSGDLVTSPTVSVV